MIKTCEICSSEFYTQRGAGQTTCSYGCNARRRRAVFEAQAAEAHQRRRVPNAGLPSKAVQMEALIR